MSAARKTESTRNTSDEQLTPDGIPLNSSTYTNLASAFEQRVGYSISNPSPHQLFRKEKDASDPDNSTLRGKWMPGRFVYESVPGDSPTGPISAIALSGNPVVYFEEY